MLGFHHLSNFPCAFSHSDASLLPTYVMHNQIELQRSASHICFLTSLLSCATHDQLMHSLAVAPTDSRLLHGLSCVFLFKSCLSTSLCSVFQMVLKVQFSTMKDIMLIIHISTKYITTTEVLNRPYLIPVTFFFGINCKF